MTPSLVGLPAKASDPPKVVANITNSAADYNNPDSESIKQEKVEEETGGIGLILATDNLLQKLQPKSLVYIKKFKPKTSTLAMPFNQRSATYNNTPLYLLSNIHFASVIDCLFKLYMTQILSVITHPNSLQYLENFQRPYFCHLQNILCGTVHDCESRADK